MSLSEKNLTLVIYTAEYKECFPEHGLQVYENVWCKAYSKRQIKVQQHRQSVNKTENRKKKPSCG